MAHFVNKTFQWFRIQKVQSNALFTKRYVKVIMKFRTSDQACEFPDEVPNICVKSLLKSTVIVQVRLLISQNSSDNLINWKSFHVLILIDLN